MPELETDHLKLPYIAAAQAQKHVTHNEALRKLDAVAQLAVLDTTLAAPPSEPEAGDRYIVAESATGDWEGQDGAIATWVDGSWQFTEPGDGWLAFDLAAEALKVRLGGDWVPAAGGMPGTVDLLGINATADETNRLAVRSEAVLFSGIEDTDGGTGDIRFVVNKEADGDTASLLFQSGWSGRAEVGLCGDTDFVFKVSADGETWIDAIRIDKDTGLSTILYDNTLSGLTAETVQDAIDEVAAASGGGGAVASVFGRTGAVAAASGDYEASQVDNDSGVSGVSVKDALDALAAGKQAADADLTALAALSSTGIAVRSASDTWTVRSIAQPAAGITVSNGSGAAGNPTLALANDLAALEGLSSTGIAVRTASDTWAQRSIAAGTNVQVTNGSGASGDPTLASTATTLNTQTSGYTLVLADAGKWIEMNVGSANNLTVPPNSSVAFPTGTIVNLTQYGAGATTVVAGSGVTIRNRNGLVLGGQYAVATLYKRGTDEWVAGGDLKT